MIVFRKIFQDQINFQRLAWLHFLSGVEQIHQDQQMIQQTQVFQWREGLQDALLPKY